MLTPEVVSLVRHNGRPPSANGVDRGGIQIIGTDLVIWEHGTYRSTTDLERIVKTATLIADMATKWETQT